MREEICGVTVDETDKLLQTTWRDGDQRFLRERTAASLRAPRMESAGRSFSVALNPASSLSTDDERAPEKVGATWIFTDAS
jgi:hypothetical protein